jgi:hypothetical protein
MRLLVGKNNIPPAWVGGGARETRLSSLPADEEMAKWFDDPLIVMPLLYTPAYDVDVLGVKGRVKAAVVRQRNNPAGIPFTGNRVISDQSIVRYCKDIAEHLQLDSLHDMDLMTDESGKAVLLEVNPRPSGSVVASHAAGIPIVAAAIAARLGLEYPLEDRLSHDVDVGVIPQSVVLNNRP